MISRPYASPDPVHDPVSLVWATVLTAPPKAAAPVTPRVPVTARPVEAIVATIVGAVALSAAAPILNCLLAC